MALFDYIDRYPDGFRILVRDTPAIRDPEGAGHRVGGTFAGLLVDVAAKVDDLLAKQFKAHKHQSEVGAAVLADARRHGGADRPVVAGRPQAQEGGGRRPPGEPRLERPAEHGAQAAAWSPAGTEPRPGQSRPPWNLDIEILDVACERGHAADEVDRIAAAWQRERPDLDVAPLQVLSRVTRLARHLDLARRQSFAAHALETWEFDVLAALRRAGAALLAVRPGSSARETLVTSGTMTNRIDRLESARPRSTRARRQRPSRRAGRPHRHGAQRGRRCDERLLAREHALLAALDRGRPADLAAPPAQRCVREFGD